MNAQKPSVPLPSEVRGAFTTATITALQELAGLEAFAETPSEVLEFPCHEVILASVELRRDNPGRLLIVLSIDTASHLAARYLPQDTPLSDEIVADVIGEFANVIAGQGKSILKGTPYHFSLSIPRVARSKRPGEWQNPVSGLIASLSCDLGQLSLALCLPPELH